MVRRDQRDSQVASGRGTAILPTAWICALLFAAAVLPYLQTFGHDFTRLDDVVYVSENPIIQQGLTWSNLAWAFTTTSTGNWHPLTYLSHMLDCELFGVRPGWHHLVNALFHGLNTVLVFSVLRSMTGAIWRSALVAALFAIHPIHVESVAWIAERKDVLSTFFGLLAIRAYAIYTQEPLAKKYAPVICFFGLSLLSKPMLVTLPFVLLLLDFWPLKRLDLSRKERSKLYSLIREKLPLLVMSVGSSVIAWKAQQTAGAMAPTDIWPLWHRLANAIVSYIRYLGKAIWPVDLAVLYPFPDQIPAVLTLLAISLIAGISIAVILSIRTRPWLTVGWFWYLGTLIPVIGLVQVGAQSMADRYTYLPLIGIFIMIAWSLPPTQTATRTRMVATATTAGAVLVILFALTFAQVRLWRSSTILFEHAVDVTERNYMAHKLLAGALMPEGKLTEARQHLEKSLQLRPGYADAHHNLGTILVRQRDFQNAKKEFLLALQTKPNDPIIWNALGLAQAHMGEMDEAIADYRRALTLNPNYAYAFANLGATLLVQGQNDEATEMCERALQLQPNNAETHATLGAALWNRGKIEESIRHNQKAIELNPNLRDARFNLALALSKEGKYDQTVEHLEYLVRLNPEDGEAQSALEKARRERDDAGVKR